MESIVQNLLANPRVAVAVVLVALGLSVALKATKKVIKIVLLLGVAYVLVNFIISGV